MNEKKPFQLFGRDLLASIVVFLVALPLCMGIAVASGVPPAMGIITGIVGGIVVGTLAGAPLQVSGPAAGLTVLVFELVKEHGVAMLGPVVFLAGVIQIFAGWAKLGRWFRAVNPSVIHGMLAGIGVLIFASQFHIMVEDSPKGSGLANLISIPKAVWDVFFSQGGWGSSHFLAGMTGLATIAVMIGWEVFKKTPLRVVPAPLVAVLAGTLIAHFGGFPIQRVSIPDSLFGTIAFPGWESWSRLIQPEILSAVIGLAIIASAETLLCASALTKMRFDAKVNYDKELLAQGVGNSVCGLLGALPMTGVIVRSTANLNAGGQTRASAILHGLWLVVFTAIATALLRYIPMASLAAVLVFTGYKLVNPQTIRSLGRYGRSAVAIYLVTLVAIVTTDLLTGVLLGVSASLLRLVFTFSNLKITQSTEPDGTVVLELGGAATVITLPKLAGALEEVSVDKPIKLRLERLLYIDHACMDLIETVRAQRANCPGPLLLNQEQLRFRYHRSQIQGAREVASANRSASKSA